MHLTKFHEKEDLCKVPKERLENNAKCNFLKQNKETLAEHVNMPIRSEKLVYAR